MDLIYTNKNMIPEGSLKYYDVDLDIGKNNDFEIQMNIQNHCMDYGSIWYVDETEYGGVVDLIKLDTYNNIVYYSGRSWRGFWKYKVIEPNAGADYYTVTGEANTLIQTLINRLNLQSLFVASDSETSFNVSNFSFDRYCTGYEGLVKMLNSVNAKPQFTFDAETGKVVVEAVAILDLSNKYEYSDDYGMQLIIETNKGGVNHLICLGSGDLSARTVIHLYADASGNISKTKTFTGLNEITAIYDYGNATDSTKLEEGGIEKLESLKNSQIMSARFSKLDVDVLDVVGGKNRMTGIKIKDVVNSMIVKIKNGRLTIDYKVGEDY